MDNERQKNLMLNIDGTDDLASLVGRELRRITFCFLCDGRYYLLFSVIEELLPGMKDFDYPGFGDYILKRASHSHPNRSADKVYYTIDRFILTQDFIDNPADNYVLNDENHTQIICGDKIQKTPKRTNSLWIENSAQELSIFKCLPYRRDSRRIGVWSDRARRMQREIMNDWHFVEQYRQVSRDYYGVDLSEYPEYIGNINIVRYNKYFRAIDWSISTEPPGIYASVVSWIKDEVLTVIFVNKSRDGLLEYSSEQPLDLSRKYHFFELPDVPELLSVFIKNVAGELVYGATDMTFVRMLAVNMQVHTKRVSLTHRDGRNETFDKFSSNKFNVGTQYSDDVQLASASQAFKLLETSLDFALFDGSKNAGDIESNRNRARNFVKRIISRASYRCLIADPYFNLDDLSNFVYSMPQSNVVVRILSAQEYLVSKYGDKQTASVHKQEAKAITKSMKDFMAAVGGNIQFRLLTGTCCLHDRYIVSDDAVWLLGTSFNEIGKRACTIVKLPQVSCKHIINMLDGWWTDPKTTISIEEYATQS